MLELKTAEKYYCILVLKLNFSQKKICKFYSAFSKLHKIPKLIMHRPIYGFGSFYLPRGREKFGKHSFPAYTHYDCCKGFLRP